MEIKDYNVSIKIKTNSAEPDYFGYVNDVSLYKYMLRARIDYWDLIGTIEEYKNSNIGPIVVKYESTMSRPIKEGDEITIYSRIHDLGKTSYHLSQIVVDKDQNICSTAETVFVVIDIDNHKKVKIAKELVKRIQEIEAGKA